MLERHSNAEGGRRSEGRGAAGDTWEAFWADETHHEHWEQPAPAVLDVIKSQSPDERRDVLDLGCGLGRHAIAFAKEGFRVTATDGSKTGVAHLKEWAAKLGLSIQTKVCDVLDDAFEPESFDIVLSYNVIYHGYRRDFAAAIEHVRDLLRPGGLFFFTCPSRQDGKYGQGEQVAPHTFLGGQCPTSAHIHYFASESDLDELLGGFRQRERRVAAPRWESGGVQHVSRYWHVLAEKA